MSNNTYDVIIIGAGPAGLSAAIYVARSNFKTLVIEKPNFKSTWWAHKIDNYPGFDEGIKGEDLQIKMKKQAMKFGVEFEEANLLDIDAMEKVVKTDKKNYVSKVIIVAIGKQKNNLSKCKGEKEFLCNGVSYCATCDGAFYEKQTVAVFGNGQEAAEDSLFLTKYAKEVLVFVNSKDMNCEEELFRLINGNSKIKIYCNYELIEIKGNTGVEEIIVRNINENNIQSYHADGIFLYSGTKSNMDLFLGIAELDKDGYIITNERMEASIEGIYAVGDIRHKDIKQIATAVSDGVIAGVESIKYMLKNNKS